jgi:hypothetical protein
MDKYGLWAKSGNKLYWNTTTYLACTKKSCQSLLCNVIVDMVRFTSLILKVFGFATGFHYVAQPGLELKISYSRLLSAGI